LGPPAAAYAFSMVACDSRFGVVRLCWVVKLTVIFPLPRL